MIKPPAVIATKDATLHVAHWGSGVRMAIQDRTGRAMIEIPHVGIDELIRFLEEQRGEKV